MLFVAACSWDTCRRGQHAVGNLGSQAEMHEAVPNCKAECECCYEYVWCIYRLFVYCE